MLRMPPLLEKGGEELHLPLLSRGGVAPKATGWCRLLFHRVKTNRIAFGVCHQRNESVLSDRELIFHDFAARRRHAARLDSAVVATEVNDDAVAVRGTAL